MLWTIFHGLACFVGPRARHFIHNGRIHPHLVGPSDCRHFDSSHLGPQVNFMIAEMNR